MKRTIAITDNPRIELALREIEQMIVTVGNTPATVAARDVVVTSSNHNQGEEVGVEVDTSGGSKSVFLGSAPTEGDEYTVTNKGTNQLTVSGMGRMINGDATLILAYENSTAHLRYNGIEWSII